MNSKIKIINCFADSGHAWAKIKRSELIALGIEKDISVFSYQRGDFVYLEEDSDLSLFVEAAKTKNITYIFKTKHTNKRSKIRSYEHYQGAL